MNNPPAFPTTTFAQKTEGGMTLRDYLAAKAMQGVVSATEPLIKIDEPHLAMWSYKMADAMLAARENK